MTKKKLKSLIDFVLPIKSSTTTEGGREKKKIHKNLQNKWNHKNNKCFSWVTAVRILSLSGSHNPPHLPRMPSNTVLISGPAVGAARILIWSYSCVFLPPVSTALRTSAFSFVGFSMSFYIFHRHRVCLVDHVDLSLVDHVDLICSLYSWWEGFGSSLLATLPLGFSCFISTSACGSSTGVCSWGCPGGLEFASVQARYGGGAGAWVAGVLAVPDIQVNWWLGQ